MSLIRIAVMATGSELLNGSSSDTNTRDIARLLGEVGYRLTTSVCVGDDPDAIARSLRQLLTDYDVIICTGGLGSTGDDLTAKTVALALGRALEENPKAVEMIAQNCKERQRDFDAPLRRQAQMPQKSVPLVNQVGTAPGFWLPLSLIFLLLVGVQAVAQHIFGGPAALAAKTDPDWVGQPGVSDTFS